MPLERGAVYRALIEVARRGGLGGTEWAEKYIVVLQDPGQMDAGATRYSYVIASTDRTGGRGLRAFEAQLGTADGFSRSTIVDGRWVYTELREELAETDFCFTLSEQRMDEISLAVFIGLQLST